MDVTIPCEKAAFSNSPFCEKAYHIHEKNFVTSQEEQLYNMDKIELRWTQNAKDRKFEE